MILEQCPYCGKSFKRLKAHIPHCKLSPLTKPTSSSNIPKEMQTSPSQNMLNNNKTNKITNKKQKNPSLQTNKKPKSKAFEKTIMNQKKRFSNLQETVTGVPTEESIIRDTVKPKMKWLAKREEEMMKQAHVLTWKGMKLKSILKQDVHNRKTGQSPEKATPQLNTANTTKITTNIKTTISDLQRVSYTGSFGTKQSTPTPEVKTVKTSVWDHIKYGLYDKRSSCAPIIYKVCKMDNLSQHTVNNVNTIDSLNVQVLSNFQTSLKRPAEQILTSQLQNMNIRGYTPNMATGYEELFSSPYSEVSYNEDFIKHQSSKTSRHSHGKDCIKEQRLGDVRLREVTFWLVSRAPTSPREAVAMLNKGRHWYYRKYIDVQRGGIGGIAMLVAGYCALSYIWSYPHLKQERWRKYH